MWKHQTQINTCIMPEVHPIPEPLPVALLLATTGGMLDAFVYLNHGHVFANAMTGNVVLLGISALSHNWVQALRHFVPLCAFVTGVTAAKFMGSRLRHRAGLIGLTIETAALFTVSLLPASFPQMAFTAIIAFVASYQVASFRYVDSFSYNSTFVTGNLRTVVDGLYEALSPSTHRQGLKKAKDLGLICLCFLLGVIAGATLAPRFANHTLWFALPLLVIAAVLVAPAALASPK
jgi:uncharacterized membrane protein YoaK (UPF0700 family)